MNKPFRYLLYFFIFAIFLFGLARLYYSLTDDFRLGNITYDMTGEYSWEVPKLSQEEQDQIKEILSQKFYYIGKGAQSYAFGSEDQKYVLKFFKFKHLKPNWFLNLLPSIPPFEHYKIKSNERRKRKLLSVFRGYDLAFRENKEGAGLIYVHLQPTTYLKQKVTLIDKMGLDREYNLDDVVFLLQRKGETLRSYVSRELDQGNVKAAEQAYVKVIDMYMIEYRKGLYDRDHGVMHNTGFVDGQPFHLDVGFLTQDDSMKTVEGYKDDLAYVIWKINKWIKATYPQYYPELSSFLSDLYYKKTGFVFDSTTVDPHHFKKKKE